MKAGTVGPPDTAKTIYVAVVLMSLCININSFL